MAIFGIETSCDKVVSQFIADTNERLKIPNMVINPFEGGIKKVQDRVPL